MPMEANEAAVLQHGQGALQAQEQQAAAPEQPQQQDGAGAAQPPAVGGAAAAPAAAPAAAAAAGEGPGGPAQAAGDAPGAAPGDGGAQEARAAKRQKPNPPDFAYSPSEACDLVLRTSDGRRIGVHRLILLRACGFFRALLEACEEEEVRGARPARLPRSPHRRCRAARCPPLPSNAPPEPLCLARWLWLRITTS
jgi:hypothetical protein